METIRFRCPNPRCGRKLSAPASKVGSRGTCPRCGTILRVGEEAQVIRLPRPERQPPRPQEVPPPPEPPFRITCPTCGTSLLVGPEMVGELINCPRCREFMTVPEAEELEVVEEEGEVELEVIEEDEGKKPRRDFGPAKLELEPVEVAPEEEEERERAAEGAPRSVFRQIFWPGTVTGWLVSVAIHVGIILILMLATFVTIKQVREPVGKAGVEIVEVRRTMGPEIRRKIGPPSEPSDVRVDTGPPSIAAELPLAERIEIASRLMDEGAEWGSSPPTLGVASPFGLRNRGGRITATAAFGGTRESENAVNAGLRWLARVQEPGGYWAADKYDGTVANNVGVTALALVAFLGAGHTHQTGIYADVVQRGVDYLLSNQGEDGGITRGMYENGIGALVICELYAMTRDEDLKEPAQRVIDFIEYAQNRGAGWRYGPRYGQSDTSVTGWQLMALKSGKMADLRVSDRPIEEALEWLERVSSQDGHVRYREGEKATPATTAVALLCRQLFGYDKYSPMVRGPMRVIRANLPAWTAEGKGTGEGINYYYWYYATLGMFNYGGEEWEDWNSRMRDLLVEHQVVGGEYDGSWDPVGRWCEKAGRVYSTAMAAATLEVYYRYLPIYARPKVEFEAAAGKSIYYGHHVYEKASYAWLRYHSMVGRGLGETAESIELREQSIQGFREYLQWRTEKAELTEEEEKGARLLAGEATYRLATLYYRAGELGKAESFLTDFEEKFPEYWEKDKVTHLQALIDTARSERLRFQGDREKANEYREKALAPFLAREAPEEWGFEVLVWGADSVRTHDENYRRALALYERALSRYGYLKENRDQIPAVKLKMLECYIRSEEWDGAISEGEKVTNENFRGTEYGEAGFGAFTIIGDRLNLVRNEPGRAAIFYGAALRQVKRGELEPQVLSVRLKLGSCYIASEQWSRAMGVYEELVREFPGSVELTRSLALAYKGAGYPENALERFIEVQDMVPRGSEEWLEARYNIAEVRLLGDQPVASLASISLTRELWPSLGGAVLRAKFEDLERRAKAKSGK